MREAPNRVTYLDIRFSFHIRAVEDHAAPQITVFMAELERYDPALGGRIKYEHYHRYAFACELVAGLNVLDIASGEGYGSAMLATAAAQVSGVDIDAQTVSAANVRYGLPDRLSFHVGQAQRIPFPDATFDVVTSFETIEHIDDPQALVREIKRVLKPDGFAIISTPNKSIYNHGLSEPNAFHVHEMEMAEFVMMMEASFKSVTVFGQRMVVASSLSPMTLQAANRNAADYRGYTVTEAKEGLPAALPGITRLPDPEYIVCIVSDVPVPYPAAADSIFLMREHDLWREHFKVMHWASGLHNEDEELRAALRHAEEKARNLDAANERIAEMSALREAHEQEIVRLGALADTGSDLSNLAPLLEEIAGEPIKPEIPSLIRLLNRISVERATQDVRLAEYQELKDATKVATGAVEELRRRLREAEDLGASLQKKLANEFAIMDRRVSEMQVQWALEVQKRTTAEAALVEHSNQASAKLKAAQDELAAAVRRAEALSLESIALSEARLEAEMGLRDARAALQVAEETGSVANDQGRADTGGPASGKLAAIEAGRSSIRQQLQRSHGALADLSAQGGVEASTPARRPRPKSFMKRMLTLLKSSSASPRTRRDTRLSDTLLRTIFDEDHYVRANRLSLAAGQSALDHYFSQGQRRGLSPHPLIDPDWMKRAREGHTSIQFDLVDYLFDSSLFKFSPHPVFDAEYYLSTNPDVRQSGGNPLVHYLLHGWREGRSPNALFDTGWYLAENPDVLQAGVNPLLHYVRYGAAENRQPHPLFDRDYYLARNPDVASSGMEPYAHYMVYGRHEGRKPSPLVESIARYYPILNCDGVIELLLGDHPHAALHFKTDVWPPDWDGEYWLPQQLRDLIIDRYGLDKIDLYIYLFGVIERFAAVPEAFDTSEDCALLMSRAKTLAARAPDGRTTVSIIVPVYNNLLYTLTCIVSVLEIEHTYSFEVIVADDLSNDGTKEAIEAIGGVVRLKRNAQNLGFLLNCNAAAEIATGDYLVMLNNDVIVLPGWLDNLIEPLTRESGIGFVGSKLINGDGSLQEAGGIFWQDGSAWNYGRNSDASLPEFNYLKDVDYASGASIAIPRKIWDELGGFDPVFTPAYCEDADIAFRIREAGYRAVYHPHSVLVHHEGRSHGRDTNSGIKAYQVVNQDKFLERWGKTLKLDHFPNAQETFLARDRSRAKPHILVIDHYVPQWDRDAGSRTVFQYIRMFLERGFAVTFWPDNLHEDREYTAPLQAMGVEVIYHPAYVGKFQTWIAENGKYFRYALMCRPHIAEKYIDDVRAHRNIKSIYYGVDLHCKRLESAFAQTGDRHLLKEAVRWEAIERRICNNCDVVLYPGYHEVEVVRGWVSSDAEVLNFPITIFSDSELDNGLANLAKIGTHDPFSLMFVGGFTHHPNVGAVKWFVEKVLPRLRRADQRFHIRIAGSNAPPEISRLDGAGVTMLGRVSDQELLDMYQTAGFAVVPLLYGAGVKGKAVEAMARGVPVVMTSVGAQGIENAETLAIVEDDPKAMAEAIIAAAANRDECVRKGKVAVDFIRRWYSERAVANLLLPHIPELAPAARTAEAG